MIEHEIQLTTPTSGAVCERLAIIEERYDVSLKFWLSFEEVAVGVTGIRVLGSGSGELFDLLESDQCVVSSLVLSAWSGSVLPGIWHILGELERRFWTVESKRTARPIP